MNSDDLESKGDRRFDSFGEALTSLSGIESTEGLVDMFVDSIPAILGIQDAEHTVLRYNRPGYDYFDMTPEQTEGKKCYEIIGRDDVCEECATSEALRTGKPSYIEKYVPGPGLWFDVRAYPVRSAKTGEITGVIEHLLDITRSKSADEARESSESRHRHLLQTMQEGLVEQTGKDLSYVNDSFCRMIGYDRSELVGSDIRMLFDDMNWEFFTAQQGLREQGRTDPYEIEMRRKDGSVLPVYVSPYAEVRDGRLVKSSGVVTDISILKQAEQEKLQLTAQVQYAQKLESLGILAGGIAHDFNNLLMTVMGNADLVLDELGGENRVSGPMKEIISAARQASDLACQMLTYAGRSSLSREPLDLNEVVEGMMGLMEVSFVKKDSVRLDLAPGLPAVLADPTQLRQIIMNLVTNASEAIASCGSTVRVETFRKHIGPEESVQMLPKEYCPVGDFVCLQVSDDGCGIETRIQDRLFDPFFTTKQAGRGLGLAVLLGIVSSHDGCVRVQSEPGIGSCFTVCLPAHSAVSGEDVTGEERKPGRPGIGGTVLVIDDEAVIRDVICRMISRLGVESAQACDLESVQEHLESHRDGTALIIVDHSMPGQRGDQLIRALGDLVKGIPVVVSSGYGREEVVPRYEGLDVQGFLHKPYDSEELARLLERISPD